MSVEEGGDGYGASGSFVKIANFIKKDIFNNQRSSINPIRGSSMIVEDN